MYTGCLYNEIFSVPMLWFESMWSNPDPSSGALSKTFPHTPPGSRELSPPNGGAAVASDPYITSTYSYPFGVDPGWAETSNKLNYLNSLKMKMSIIFGVSHMFLGNFAKMANCIYFKKKKDLVFEFIPEVVFLGTTFGYM